MPNMPNGRIVRMESLFHLSDDDGELEVVSAGRDALQFHVAVEHDEVVYAMTRSEIVELVDAMTCWLGADAPQRG